MTSYHFENAIKAPIAVGLLYSTGIDLDRPISELDKRIELVLEQRRHDLNEREDAFRKRVRDMLRNGSYKPTGRGKPASEYLLKTARKGDFPRINTVVDINNYLSMKYLVPISLWDLNRAGGTDYRFKLGGESDSFVFNSTGQEIDLQDLVCGYVKREGDWVPIVNPIKDSMLTKTTDETQNIGVAAYYPADADREHLNQLMNEFWELLVLAGGKTETLVLEPPA